MTAATGRGSLFDARYVRCEKCGSDDVCVRWHGEGSEHDSRHYDVCREYGRWRGEPKEEHLHYTCRTCSWQWHGPPAQLRTVLSLDDLYDRIAEAAGERDFIKTTSYVDLLIEQERRRALR